jgi:hypothetical protein
VFWGRPPYRSKACPAVRDQRKLYAAITESPVGDAALFFTCSLQVLACPVKQPDKIRLRRRTVTFMSKPSSESTKRRGLLGRLRTRSRVPLQARLRRPVRVCRHRKTASTAPRAAFRRRKIVLMPTAGLREPESDITKLGPADNVISQERHLTLRRFRSARGSRGGPRYNAQVVRPSAHLNRIAGGIRVV